jgi:hypothetical protein
MATASQQHVQDLSYKLFTCRVIGFGIGTRWFQQDRRDELTPDLPLLDDVVKVGATGRIADHHTNQCCSFAGS